MKDEEQQLALADVHSFVERTRAHPRVGDAIRAFHADCGTAYCEGCGKHDPEAGQCKGCHVARYCSVACQQLDWKVGGHATECQAIQENHEWSCYTNDAEALVPLRHLLRCSALLYTPEDQDAYHAERPAPDQMHLSAVGAQCQHWTGSELEPIGKYWMQGIVKHPGSFKRAVARADHGRFKGRTAAFAHHVLANRDHKHGSALLHKRAALALTFMHARKRRGRRGK
jgi:hypothetical protein